MPSSVAAAVRLLRAVGLYMAFLASPVASPHWGTNFGGFGPAAIATGSRGRATSAFVGAFTASSVLSPTSAFSVDVASTFPVAATCTIAGVQGMPRVRFLLTVSGDVALAQP